MSYLTLNAVKLIHWGKVLSKFFSLQLLLQFITALTGILIIRVLDKSEYALYTISFSMQTALTTLSEMGIASVLISKGGSVWSNKTEFGSLLNTSFELRRYMFAASIVFVIPFALYFLMQNGSSLIYAIVISSLMLIDLFAKIFTGYKTLVPRLYSDITYIVVSEAKSQLIRLGLVILSFFTICNTAILNVITFLGSLFNKNLIDKYASTKIDINAPVNKDYKREMIKVAKSQFPFTVFYVFQGQLTILIISYFGNTTNVSEIGALSRLGLLLNFFLSAVVNFVSPRFAKEESIIRLRKLYIFCLGIFLIISIAIMLLSFFFPNYFLIILGSQYSNLHDELPLVVLLSLVNSLIGVIYTMNYSKTWIRNSWLIIPTTIAFQIFLVFQFDLSVVSDVVIFGILSLLPNLLVNLFMSFNGLKLIPWKNVVK